MKKKLVIGVSKTIKILRDSKEISQEELADKSNLDRTYISGVERGVRNITLNSLESIVYGLDIELADFLDELKTQLQSEKNINPKDSSN